MRKTFALTALFVASLVGHQGIVIAQTDAPSISAICAFEFAAAADRASESASAPSTADDPGVAPAASIAPAVGATEADRTPTDESLDAAVRSCASLDEWMVAAQLYPEAMAGRDPRSVLIDRCGDPGAGLAAYATCGSLAVALATPAPTPAPTAVPEPTPAPAVRPTPARDASPAGGSGGAKPRANAPRGAAGVRVSKAHVARIPSASEIIYFDIKGDSPASLLRANQRQGRRHCGDHGAIACVLLTWDVEIDKRIGTDRKCVIAKAETTLRSRVFLPRWTGRKRAPAALVRWWRTVLLESAVHESRHIAIQKRHLADYRKDAKGKACGSATILLNRHMKAANEAQAAFDRVEYTKPLPPLPSSLLR